MSKHLKYYDGIRALRAKGYTYFEINQELGTDIPKASMHHICKEIVLTDAQTKRINNLLKELLTANRHKALVTNRAAQETLLDNIRKSNLRFRKLSDREAKIALAFLYLGEGAKHAGHRGLYLGSSDPKIISVYIDLMERCYGIKATEFKCRISYRADQDLNILEDYWSKHTGIPRINFYKTKPDPRTVGKPTLRTDYKGVCVLTRKGTAIQLELQAIADIIGSALRGVSSAG